MLMVTDAKSDFKIFLHFCKRIGFKVPQRLFLLWRAVLQVFSQSNQEVRCTCSPKDGNFFEIVLCRYLYQTIKKKTKQINMSQNMCGEFTQPKTPRNPPKLLKIIVQPEILQDMFGCRMQWHTLPTFSNAFPTKMDPVRSALDFVAQPTGPPLVHAAHYCRETQKVKVWRYDPWKLHLSGVGFVDGKFFSDSGAQGYGNNMFATTCENSEHGLVTATLHSHLNFFLPEDILRSFNFWTPRVSDGMHCMVGNNDVLQCKMCICKMLRFSEAGAAVVSNYLRYLSIFAYWFIFFSAWFWRHLIYIEHTAVLHILESLAGVVRAPEPFSFQHW